MQTPKRGDMVSLVLLPEMNLSEGKGLLRPEERFGQTRMEPAEEREALVETGGRGANPVRGPRWGRAGNPWPGLRPGATESESLAIRGPEVGAA